jgi:hypothetical protein
MFNRLNTNQNNTVNKFHCLAVTFIFFKDLVLAAHIINIW